MSVLALCVLLQHALRMLLRSGEPMLYVAVVQAWVPHKVAVLPSLQLVQEQLDGGQLRGGNGATALHDGCSEEGDIGVWLDLLHGDAGWRRWATMRTSCAPTHRWVVTLTPGPGRPSPWVGHECTMTVYKRVYECASRTWKRNTNTGCCGSSEMSIRCAVARCALTYRRQRTRRYYCRHFAQYIITRL